MKPTGPKLFKKPAGTTMDDMVLESGRSSAAINHNLGGISVPKTSLNSNMILQNDVSATFIGFGLKIDES